MASQHQGGARRFARRAVGGGPLLVLVIAGLLVASVQETSALLSGNTRNVQNGVSSSAVYSPSGLTATNQGSSVQLSWTAAQPNNNGNGNGYVVSGTSNGASPTCPSAAGAYGVFVGSSASTTYTDSTSSLLSGTPGSYICYLVQTGYNPAGPPPWSSIPIWTSADTLPVVAVQLAPIISGWAVCDRDGLVLPVTADWLHPTGTYIIYANVSGASTVTADLGVVGSTPFASNIALTAVSASCAGTTYGYSSAVTTASNYSAGTNPALYVDIKATAGATTARSNQSHVGDASPDSSAPPAPGSPTATAGALLSGQITIHWTASADAGGAGLAGYQLKVFLTGTTISPPQYPTPQLVGPTATSFLFTLITGLGYDFSITASDNAGNNGSSATLTNVRAP